MSIIQNLIKKELMKQSGYAGTQPSISIAETPAPPQEPQLPRTNISGKAVKSESKPYLDVPGVLKRFFQEQPAPDIQDIRKGVMTVGKFIKGAQEEITRSGASVGLSYMATASKLSPIKGEGVNELDISGPEIENVIARAIFGNKPLRSIEKRIQESDLTTKKFAQELQEGKIDLPFIQDEKEFGAGIQKHSLLLSTIGIVALGSLDFTGGGGKKQTIELIAKAKDVGFIAKTLRQIGVSEDLVLPMGEKFSKISNKKTISTALNNYKELENASKLAKGVMDPSSSEGVGMVDEFIPNKPQIDNEEKLLQKIVEFPEDNAFINNENLLRPEFDFDGYAITGLRDRTTNRIVNWLPDRTINPTIPPSVRLRFNDFIKKYNDELSSVKPISVTRIGDKLVGDVGSSSLPGAMIDNMAQKYGVKIAPKETANAFISKEGVDIPTQLKYKSPHADAFKFLNTTEKNKVYDEFIKEGGQHSKKDFFKDFSNDIFDASTGKIVEIGGDAIPTKSLRHAKLHQKSSLVDTGLPSKQREVLGVRSGVASRIQRELKTSQTQRIHPGTETGRLESDSLETVYNKLGKDADVIKMADEKISPTGTKRKKIKKIDPEDKERIIEFLDNVRLRQGENIQLEIDATVIAEAYGLNPNVSKAKLANALDKLLLKTPVSDIVSVQPSSGLKSLVEEARKYKSAEEFIKNFDLTVKKPPKFLFRGIGGDNVQAQQLVRGTHFSDELSTAREFAGMGVRPRKSVLEPIQKEKLVNAYELSSKAKIADLDQIRMFLAKKKILANSENITKALKEKGYDGAIGILPGKGRELIIVKDVNKTTAIKKLDITRDQLTNFYNQVVRGVGEEKIIPKELEIPALTKKGAPIAKQEFSGIIKYVKEHGGITTDFNGNIINKGFAFSVLNKVDETRIPLNKLSSKSFIKTFNALKNKYGDKEGLHFGGWVEDNVLIVDVSAVSNDVTKSIYDGIIKKQDAIGDLAKYAKGEDGTIFISESIIDSLQPISRGSLESSASSFRNWEEVPSYYRSKAFKNADDVNNFVIDSLSAKDKKIIEPPLQKPPIDQELDPENFELYEKFNETISKKWTKIREVMEDDWIRVKKLIGREDIKISDVSNMYDKRKLLAGRVHTRFEELDKISKTIDREIIDSSRKFNIDDEAFAKSVNDYLHAKHAPERNAKLGDGAAGMKTDEANKIIQNIESSKEGKEVKKIANTVLALNRKTLDILLEGGVITEDLHGLLRQTYKNHVPLQRIMDEADNLPDILSGKGLDVKGTGLFKAKGSERQVRDIWSNVVANYKQALVRAEKNIVDNATLKFARDNEHLDLFEIIKPKAIGRTFGKEGEEGKLIFQKINDPTILHLFENGKPIYIKIKDPQLAVALKGVNRKQLDGFFRFVGSITRFYSGLATRFNPEFALPNKFRDIQEVMVYLAAQKETGFKGSTKVLTQEPGSFKSILEHLTGKDTEGARLYQQMRMDGGTTGGLGLSTRQQIDVDLKQIKKLNRSNPRKAVQFLFERVDDWNTLFEDSTRLSVYKTALSQGVSRQKAAVLAKQASIDFNKFGTGGPIINSLYMFSNASIQGSAKMLMSMKNPKVAGAVIAASGTAVFATSQWNDNLDPKWRDKVSKWED